MLYVKPERSGEIVQASFVSLENLRYCNLIYKQFSRLIMNTPQND